LRDPCRHASSSTTARQLLGPPAESMGANQDLVKRNRTKRKSKVCIK
ncbi:hypothetical protein RvY_00346, partial [Ramazzottius varieornatus]